MSLLRKYFSLPVSDKIFFIAAVCLSLIVKLIVFTLPLRWYSRFLDQSAKTQLKTKGSNEVKIRQITNAVNRCSRYAPWSTKCLVDAITAKILLQWNGVNSTMYLGVNKDDDKKLIAHAWLKCGEKFITGKKGFQKFIVVSSFS